MNITVIIATSLKRTDWLINRSLKSIYGQQKIENKNVAVIIIDDNKDYGELTNIITQVKQLRIRLNLEENEFSTRVIRNKRTRFMSGTGAWNTGISEAYSNYPNGFVSILDDDDEYLPNHLSDCLREIDNDSLAVFQRLFWKNNDGTEMQLPFTIDDLIPENFFIGNPGIQGSNMFFKTEKLIAIKGFDEKLPNTTDRDLMIRFLWYFEKHKYNLQRIKVIENLGVVHYNHNKLKVNNDIDKKHRGLDLFYQKYKAYFSENAYQKSLIRAKQFFHYIPPEQR